MDGLTIDNSNKINLYLYVLRLQSGFSEYINVMCELKQKYKDMAKIPEEEKNTLTFYVQALRMLCSTCYLQYNFIVQQINDEEKNNKNIESVYKNKIRNDYVIEIESMDTFISSLQKYVSDKLSQTIISENEKLAAEFLKDDHGKGQNTQSQPK